MKNQWLKKEKETNIFEVYNNQVAQEKSELRNVLEKYRGHCWFDSFMNELGFCKGGFLLDDCNSLQQWSAGNANLDIFYSCQFIQNETLVHSKGLLSDKIAYWPLEHTPVLPGTMTGIVKLDGEQIQTFTISGENIVRLSQTSNTNVPCMILAKLIPNTGEFIGYWDAPVEKTELIVSYEYNIG